MRKASFQKVGFVNSWTMNATGPEEKRSSKQSSKKVTSFKQSPSASSWFSLPAPIRAIFDTFPIITYDENRLPQRTLRPRNQHSLHIFTIQDDESPTNLSPNPGCLRWQAFLLMKRIPFQVIASNNHASPTGALPFVVPASKSKRDPQPQAIGSSKLQRWAETQGAGEEQFEISLEAYMSLVDQNIRNGWLYALYLQEHNFDGVARKLYVDTASTNPVVRTALAYELQAAAKEQLLKTRTTIDEDELYDAADAAFHSLATKLGAQRFFHSTDSPGLLDVSVFAYTHLLLDFDQRGEDKTIMWRDRRLVDLLLRHERLVTHRNDVLKYCLG